MAFAVFGPGIIIVTRTDIANQTPVNIGYSQELSLDFAGETKALFGQDQFPLVQARGTIKASGKIKAAMVSGLAWNAIFFGMSSFSGAGFTWNIGEQHAIPAAGGSVTVTASAQFDQDLGAIYDSNKYPLLKTTGSPTAGNYSVSAGGVYQFAASESGKTVDLTYTSSTTVGQSLLVQNMPIGTTPSFQLDYYTGLNQPTVKPFIVRIYACVAAKLSMAPKLTDFGMPDFDFDIYANAAGNVLNAVFPEID